MAGGRPNKYTNRIEPFLNEISALRAIGTEYEKIAKMLGIAQSTLYKHKAEIEEFMESTKKGDNKLINELEATMYDMALGRVVRKKTKIDYDNLGQMKSKEVTEEQLAPSIAALIFSLTNLAPDKWRNKQEMAFPEDEIKKAMQSYEES